MNKVTLSLLIFTAIIAGAFANYDEKMAQTLASASYGSYCEHDVLKNLKCGNNCNVLAGFQTVDQKTYDVAYKHVVSYTTFVNHALKRFIVAFRGTSNVIQLSSEFVNSGPAECAFCKTPGAQVSKYFYNHYDTKFKTEFISSMKNHAKQYAGYDFYITGHSLGGAFATIAALHVAVEKIVPKDDLFLYTFGSPRVGNRIFARAVTANVHFAFRVVHDKDLVAHIPPCLSHDNGRTCLPAAQADDKSHSHETFYGWHIAPEIHYNADFSKYKLCTTEEDPTCSNSLSYLSLSVMDHKLYFTAKNECKKRLFNIKIPTFGQLRDFFDDDDITGEETKDFIKKILG